MSSLRNAYVAFARFAKKLCQKIGLLTWLEKRSNNRFAHWLRSQFAIYDFEDLASVDAPWWSYGSIDYISDWLAKKKNVTAFEWGSGSSTLWLSSRVKTLHSVEHDKNFASQVEKISPKNVSLQAIAPESSPTPAVPSFKSGYENCDFSEYVQAIENVEGKFDLICIDGRARVACLEAAVDRVSDDGIIVLDNSGRKEYREALAKMNVTVKDFKGWAPALPYPSRTSVITPNS